MTPPRPTDVLEDKDRKRYHRFLSELEKYDLDKNSKRDFFKHMAQLEGKVGWHAANRFMVKYRPLFEAEVPQWAEKGRHGQRKSLQYVDESDEDESQGAADTSSEDDNAGPPRLRLVVKTRPLPPSVASTPSKRRRVSHADEDEINGAGPSTSSPRRQRVTHVDPDDDVQDEIVPASLAEGTSNGPASNNATVAASSHAPSPRSSSTPNPSANIPASSAGMPVGAWHLAEISRLRAANATLKGKVKRLEREATETAASEKDRDRTHALAIQNLKDTLGSNHEEETRELRRKVADRDWSRRELVKSQEEIRELKKKIADHDRDARQANRQQDTPDVATLEKEKRDLIRKLAKSEENLREAKAEVDEERRLRAEVEESFTLEAELKAARDAEHIAARDAEAVANRDAAIAAHREQIRREVDREHYEATRALENDKQHLRTQVIDLQSQLINLLQARQLPMQ